MRTSGGPSVIWPISAKSVDRVIGHRDVVQVLHVSERVDEQGVAVRLRPPHRGRAGHARRAGLVLDHDGLADPILHFRRQHARRDVGQPAGRERHHEGDGAAGIGLRLRRWRRQHNGEKRNEEQPEPGPAGQCVCRHVSLTRSSTACDGSASTSRATRCIMPPCGCRGRGPLRGRSAQQRRNRRSAHARRPHAWSRRARRDAFVRRVRTQRRARHRP